MQEPTLLYVSDDPETFNSHGRLFTGVLASGVTVRILFDHVNGTRVPIRLVVAIVSTGQAGTAAVLGGSAGPDTNFMTVGHLATYWYLVAHELVPGGAVSTHTVDQHGYAAFDGVLQPGECVAGIYDVAANGGPFEVRVFACDPGHDVLSIYDNLPDLPPGTLQRRGIYALPSSTMTTTLPSDVEPVSFEIGAEGVTLPRASIDPMPTNAPHKGEYGVLKRFVSTTAPKGGYLYMSPRGPSATGTFIVNGKALQCHAVAAGTTIEISTLSAASFSLVTMPDINSSYPVRFTLGASEGAIASAGSTDSPIYIA